MRHRSNRFRTAACALALVPLAHAAEDVVIADFEGDSYAPWMVTGDAFGTKPARGTLPSQGRVGGFEGHGLVNSYNGGDDSTGKLVSPPFKVSRKHLNFLIGAGGFAGETCMNLVCKGKVVRTATGTHVVAGGSENLEPASWDLTDLQGETVTLEIVDMRKGTWGHINVDQIVASDRPSVMEAVHEMTIDKRYLLWPVSREGGRDLQVFFRLDGAEKPLAVSKIQLSNNPDFWMFTDLANFQGRKLKVGTTLPGRLQPAWDKVVLADHFPGEDQLYKEPLRPQYHFSSRRGWINDPNGLVFQNGVWHLFFQHNPYNRSWNNMHWGHAVSPDLLHWKEGPDALYPDAEGMMFSGSGVVAPKDKLGVTTKGPEPLVLTYTAEGSLSYIPGGKAAQAIAVSEDGGKTFQKFGGNPVVENVRPGNRDPKVFWHEPSHRWVMVMYYDGHDYGINTSPDLVHWSKTGDYKIPNDAECPDLYELPVDGNRQNTRWVAWGATGNYLVGRFDGREFKAEGGEQRHYFGAAYAGQTYDHAPGGRRVHIGWMRDDHGLEGAPFNLQMTLPMDFSLKTAANGPRLWAEPAAEVEKLRESTRDYGSLVYSAGDPDPLAEVAGGCFEVEAVIDATSPAGEMGFRFFSEFPAVWKKDGQVFSGMEGPQAPVDGKLHVRMFVDTVSLEAFVNGTFSARYIRQTPGLAPLRIVAGGGPVRFDSLKVHRIKSVWKTD